MTRWVPLDWARGLGGYLAGNKTLEWAAKWVGKKV